MGISHQDYGKCEKCGSVTWRYEEFGKELILENRCLSETCGFTDLKYGEEIHSFYKTPEEIREFIEDMGLEEELDDAA